MCVVVSNFFEIGKEQQNRVMSLKLTLTDYQFWKMFETIAHVSSRNQIINSYTDQQSVYFSLLKWFCVPLHGFIATYLQRVVYVLFFFHCWIFSVAVETIESTAKIKRESKKEWHINIFHNCDVVYEEMRQIKVNLNTQRIDQIYLKKMKFSILTLLLELNIFSMMIKFSRINNR